MENPYARPAEPAAAAATAPATPEEQRIADYEAAIGPNPGYYLPRFEAFDAGGSKHGWHWPAFFVTSFWFIYRKMWMPGVLNLLYPWVMLIGLSIVAAVASDFVKAHPVPVLVLCFLILAAPSILLPIYANAIYWRHVRNLIERMPASVAQIPEKRHARLEREGRTGGGVLGAVIAISGFVFIAILGMLAAIAIPAYQDYLIRGQVTEGLNLASAAKAGVAEYWAQNGKWPLHEDEVLDMAPTGKYVTSVQVDGGSVVITYGGRANTKITGKRLVLIPGISPRGDVVWTCGNATVPEGVQSSGGPQGSEVNNMYLPSSCRGQP